MGSCDNANLPLRGHLLHQMAIAVGDVEAAVRAHDDLLRAEQRGLRGSRGVPDPAWIQACYTASHHRGDDPIHPDFADAIVVGVRDE